MLTHDDADNGPRPWDRKHGESAAAWAAFVAYRDEGAGRSLEKTGAKLGRTRNAVGLHSARWNWTERTAAYDAWLDRQGQAATADAVADMNGRHAQLARSTLDLLTARLASLEPALLDPRELAALMRVAADLERKARGADGQAPTGAEDDPHRNRFTVVYVNDWRANRRADS